MESFVWLYLSSGPNRQLAGDENVAKPNRPHRETDQGRRRRFKRVPRAGLWLLCARYAVMISQRLNTNSSIGVLCKRIDKPKDFEDEQDMQNRQPY
jgi:hypothetical protein